MDRVELKQRIMNFILEVGNNIWEARKNGWFPYFIVLLLFTQTTYGQSTERTQKQAKVIEKRTQSTQPIRSNPNPIRTQPPQRIRTQRPYYYNPYVYGYTPYWNTNRSWDNRTYIVTTDENRIQSQSPPLRVSFGVLSEVTTQNPTLGGYLTIGGESFLLLQYHLSIPTSYPYYDNIYQWEVDEWEDRYLGIASQRKEFVIGFGKSFKRFSPFSGIGIGRVTKWDTYEDETYILSPYRLGGGYLINQTNETQLSAKLGVMYGWEWFEGLLQLTLGKEFGIGFGVGIKL